MNTSNVKNKENQDHSPILKSYLSLVSRYGKIHRKNERISVLCIVLAVCLVTAKIINSMNASVSAHMKQYGIMRSMGMSSKQLRRMIAAQAMSYALSGCIAGCLLGLPLNKMMFRYLIAEKWETGLQIPFAPLLLILLLCLGSAVLSMLRPVRQINQMSVMETINPRD